MCKCQNQPEHADHSSPEVAAAARMKARRGRAVNDAGHSRDPAGGVSVAPTPFDTTSVVGGATTTEALRIASGAYDNGPEVAARARMQERSSAQFLKIKDPVERQAAIAAWRLVKAGK